MGEDPVHLDGAVFEPLEEICDKCRVHSKPPHTGFDLQMGVQRATVNVGIIEVILCQFGVKKRHCDAVFDRFGHFGSGGKAQHQQLTRDAGSAQGERFFDAGYANPGRAAGNGSLRGRAGAMTVAIGLYNSHHFCPGHFTDQGSIVLDGIEVNLQPGRVSIDIHEGKVYHLRAKL